MMKKAFIGFGVGVLVALIPSSILVYSSQKKADKLQEESTSCKFMLVESAQSLWERTAALEGYVYSFELAKSYLREVDENLIKDLTSSYVMDWINKNESPNEKLNKKIESTYVEE
jgi:hypothetical protein